MKPQRWWTACALVCVALIASCSESTRPKPQHVALIVVDTLRADHLSVMGYPRPTSPNIDRLARNGVLCTCAISQSSFTSPSMVSLMTGRHIAKERLTVPSDLATLAESFQRSGWATGAFSSSSLVSPQQGFERGFDVFRPIEKFGPNDAIEEFIAAHADRSTFTFVHLLEPHDPYDAPTHPWRDAASFLPGDRAEYYQKIGAELGLGEASTSIRRIQEEIGGYDDGIKAADERIGALLAIYEKLGLRDKLCVVLTADHGEGLWEQVALMNGQRGAKLRAGETPTLLNTLMPTHGNQVHRSLVHVPVVFSGVGLPRGKPYNAPVENVDIFPTLLELADLPTPGGLQGSSLLARFTTPPSAPTYAFSYTRFNVTVIDDQGWALILPTAEGECAEGLNTELYLLGEDPNQRRDRSAEKPEVVARLREVAEQRMRDGIRAADNSTSDESIGALNQLGYADQVQIAQSKQRLEKTSVADLLTELVTPLTPCSTRMLIAEELGRRPLDAETRSTLEAAVKRESARGVRELIEQALAR